MIAVGESDNARIINAENGKNLHDSLQNAEGAGEQNIAARNVKKVPGYSTAIGVLRPLNNALHHSNRLESNGMSDLRPGSVQEQWLERLS